MQSKRKQRCHNLKRCSGFFASLILQGVLVGVSFAQVPTAITSDGSVGTVVTQNGNVHDITGGSRPGNGPNLFQSFGQFTVGAGDIANFHNDGGLPTENILSRVTGGEPSQIFGSIQTTNFGNANLFLLNPAGVVFGPSASLNVGGSFHVTTADVVQLGDQGVFFANVDETSVLTMGSPETFGFLSPSPRSIVIDQGALEVPSEETLSLVGGNIVMTGGTLTAPNGQIALASLASEGMVNVSQESVPQVNSVQLGEIRLSDGVSINADGDNGGTIVIRGGRFMIDGSRISTNTTGSSSGSLGSSGSGIDIQVTGDLLINNETLIEANVSGGSMEGGDIVLKATANLTVNGSSSIQAHPMAGSGDAGKIVMEADQMLISGFSLVGSQASPPALGNAGDILVTANGLQSEFAFIFAPTLGEGQAGDIYVNIPGGDIFLNGVGISANSFGSGGAGHVRVDAGNLQLTFFSNIESQSTSSGTAGGVTLNLTGNLNVQDRSSIQVNSQNDNANSDLNITAKDIVITGIKNATFPETDEFTGFSTQTTSGFGADINIMAENLTITDTGFVSSSILGAGKAGDVILSLNEDLVLNNGGEITALTRGAGNAGNIIVQADIVDLNGGNSSPFVRADGTPGLAFGLITTQSEGSGNAGNIDIAVRQVNILDGAAIDSRSKGEGNGGTIRVSADNILIFGENPAKTTFLIQNGLNPERGLASITTENEGLIPGPNATGIAGDIFLEARNELSLDRGLISARSGSAGDGGRIQVNTGDLSLSTNSSITAQSTSSGNAGNIILFANNTILVDNSTVTTESMASSGGNIDLQARELIRLNDSTISSSVQGDSSTGGGNISLDPEFIILQNSQILAQAVEGQGGNISMVATNAVLVDPFSVLDASSALGVSGSVDIQAPIQNLSGTIAPLPEDTVPVSALYGARCAAGQGGHFSTFVNSKAESLSPTPSRFLASPLLVSSTQAPTTADPSNFHSPVMLTASLAPLLLGQTNDPTTACP